MLLMWICAWLAINAALVDAATPRPVLSEASPIVTSVDPSTSTSIQPTLGDSNPVLSIVTQPTSVDPGPVSIQTPSSTSEETTMAPTSTTEQSSSSTSSSSLDFTVHNMTTCTSSLISWSYTGEEAQLLLTITGVPSSALSRFKARQSTIQEQLADTNTSASSWTWSSVDLTQGWYEIQGLALATPNVGNNSAPFFITNGTNVACLTDASTASPGASASSSATPTTNVLDVAGGVVGGVVGVVLVIIAGIWLWSRKRKRSFVKDRGNNRQKWGSLKSTNSDVPPGGGGIRPTDDRFHDNSESTEGVLEDVAGGKGSATTTPGESDEDAAIMGEEKPISPPSSPGISPSDALNTHIYDDPRAPPYYPVQIPTTFGSEAFRSRTASGHTSNQSIEQQAQRIPIIDGNPHPAPRRASLDANLTSPSSLPLSSPSRAYPIHRRVRSLTRDGHTRQSLYLNRARECTPWNPKTCPRVRSLDME
ncbi:hypothetical protein J3R82DRAFT_6453 [Butyriboletus roseoflavus]|nr:hypothetical protein J3R82DRAFT_6453 [Butyriboletus roseoflavus]